MSVKPRMMHAIPAQSDILETREFIALTDAFGDVKRNAGLKPSGEFVIVWHGDISPQKALDLARKTLERGWDGYMTAGSIEGPMVSTDPDDFVAKMVNQAWLEWNEAFN